jgi:ABC-type phosphate/phosphonate transport system substrate-binding protein
MKRFLSIILLSVLSGVVVGIGPMTANSETNSGVYRVRFGVSTAIMSGETNQNDMIAMAKIWAGMIVASTSSWKDANGEVFEDLGRLESSLNSGAVDLVAMATRDYVQMEGSLKAKPSFTYCAGGQIEIEYLLLVHKDSNIFSLKDLKNKRIAITFGERNNLAPLWMDILLMREGLKTKQESPVNLKLVNKSTQAILPVFFRQMDAAIVSRQAFETSSKLNPQLSKNLRVIAASPRLVPIVVVMRNSLTDSQKALILERVLKLHETPGGLQTLIASKLDRMSIWKSEYFLNVKSLVEEYEKLSKAVK